MLWLLVKPKATTPLLRRRRKTWIWRPGPHPEHGSVPGRAHTHYSQDPCGNSRNPRRFGSWLKTISVNALMSRQSINRCINSSRSRPIIFVHAGLGYYPWDWPAVLFSQQPHWLYGLILWMYEWLHVLTTSHVKFSPKIPCRHRFCRSPVKMDQKIAHARWLHRRRRRWSWATSKVALRARKGRQ